MIGTVYYRDGNTTGKINFQMRDMFGEKARRKEVKGIIGERCPDIKERIIGYEWRF